MRGASGVEEIRLEPLSRAEVAEQVAALAGGAPPPQVVDELYARAEGNPFFTEQLVAAALADAAGGGLRVPARPLSEDLLRDATEAGPGGGARGVAG